MKVKTIRYAASGDNNPDPQPYDIVNMVEWRGGDLIVYLESYEVFMRRRIFWWPSQLFKMAFRALWINTKRRVQRKPAIDCFTTISDVDRSL